MRPRNATCGLEARSQQLHQRNDCANHHAAKQARTENAENGCHRHHELRAVAAPELFECCRRLNKPITADEHDGCEYRLRERSLIGRKERTTTKIISRAATSPESGVRAPPLSFTRDCDIPPLIGKPWPSPAMTFEAGNAEKFLVGSNDRRV